MERVLSICQHCSLPTCSSLVLQILYAFKPSHRFSPSKHPCSSLVSSTYRKLLSGSSSLRCRERTTQNRANASSNCSICNECILDFHCGRRTSELSCSSWFTSQIAACTSWADVLAWGNSVGDLVADVAVAVAKAGQLAKAMAMAIAGCFAGPMFNMLFGLGTVLVIQTANVYPEAYELHFHVSIVIAFVFLHLSSEPDGFSLSSNSVQVLGAKVLGILPCRSLHSFYNSEPDHCKVLTLMSDQIKGERGLGSEKPSSYLVKGTSNADVVFI